MHAYLIVGDEVNTESEIMRVASERNVKPLEFSIDKIEKTRELTGFLKLSQPEGTLIVIKNIDSATEPSLNAFLKNLEEPNVNVTYLLTARNEFRVLPTILSRCQIIRLQSNNNSISKNDLSDVETFFNSKTGKKIQLLDGIKKREDAIDFLEKLLLYVHLSLSKENIKYDKASEYLKILQQTLDAIGQNGNVTMQLTNMLVKIERTGSFADLKKV